MLGNAQNPLASRQSIVTTHRSKLISPYRPYIDEPGIEIDYVYMTPITHGSLRTDYKYPSTTHSLYLSNTSTLSPATSRSKDQASNSRSPHSIPPNISRVDYLGHSPDHYSDEYSNYNTGTIYEGYGNSPGGRVTFRILDETSSSSAMYPDTLQGLDFMYFHDRRQRGFQGSNNFRSLPSFSHDNIIASDSSPSFQSLK